MPLSVNVGLSRKASKDYQSTGVSINVTAELDQSLLARPEDLQRQIESLYRQAEEAITRRAGAPEPAQRANSNGYRARPNGNGRNNGNGNGYRPSNNGGAVTQSQRRAIIAIAERAHIDAEAECRDMMGTPLDQLTLRQASEMIDHLKRIEPAGIGR